MLNQRNIRLADFQPPSCFYLAVDAYQCINRDDYYEAYTDAVKSVLAKLANLECTFVQSSNYAYSFEIQLGVPCKTASGTNLFDLLTALRTNASLDAAMWQLVADRRCIFNRLTFETSYMYRVCALTGVSCSDGLVRQLAEPARSPTPKRGDIILGARLVEYSLTDSPCLFVPFGDTRLALSLSVNAGSLPYAEYYLPARDAHWRYLHTTHELVPVFEVVLPELRENRDLFYSELTVFAGRHFGNYGPRDVYLYPRTAAPQKERVFTSPYLSDAENKVALESTTEYTGNEYLRLVEHGQSIVRTQEEGTHVK